MSRIIWTAEPHLATLNRKTDPTGSTPLSPETEGCLLLYSRVLSCQKIKICIQFKDLQSQKILTAWLFELVEF